METIIGLLFILLPIIFKLIEKRLQNSGNAEQAGKVVAQLREMETKFNEEQIAEIKKLLVESNVLQAIYNIHAKQNL